MHTRSPTQSKPSNTLAGAKCERVNKQGRNLQNVRRECNLTESVSRVCVSGECCKGEVRTHGSVSALLRRSSLAAEPSLPRLEHLGFSCHCTELARGSAHVFGSTHCF